MEGMRSFARTHKDELDPFKTIVLAIDSVGKGDVRWVTSEGMTISFEMDTRVGQLCEAIAEADREDENRYRAAPSRTGYAHRRPRRPSRRSARERHHLPRARRDHPRATTTRPEDVPGAIDPEALDRAEGFTLDLIRALDRDLARTRSRQPEAPAEEPTRRPRRRRPRA